MMSISDVDTREDIKFCVSLRCYRKLTLQDDAEVLHPIGMKDFVMDGESIE